MMKWNVIGECIQGASHIRGGKPCQDALKTCHIGNKGIICTLADGHGSEQCKYSADGARIATAVALSILETMVWHTLDEALYDEIRNLKDVTLPKRIEREWKEEVRLFHQMRQREAAETDKALYKLYGTTLIILFVTADFIFAMQIGDGDLLVVFDGGETSWLLEMEHQLGTETYSLCQNHSWKYFRNKLIPLSEHTAVPQLFLASTDGYANSFISSEDFLKIGRDYLSLFKAHSPKVIQEHLNEWLSDASASGSGDDITFVLVYNESLERSFGG